jgi:hypothetical protein
VLKEDIQIERFLGVEGLREEKEEEESGLMIYLNTYGTRH